MQLMEGIEGLFDEFEGTNVSEGFQVQVTSFQLSPTSMNNILEKSVTEALNRNLSGMLQKQNPKFKKLWQNRFFVLNNR